MEGSKIPVGIIDDHKLFRSGVEDIINESVNAEVVLSVSTSAELYNGLEDIAIDILLLDINLKGENGLDILEKLKQSNPEIKCIMLTMHNEATYINTMVKKGAHGYLTKDTTPEELLSTISKVHEFGKYYGTEVANIIVENLQSNEQLKGLGVNLTELEIEILHLISDGLTADEIGKKVYKSSRTIEGYRKKILEKTGTKNVAELVAWGFKNGIL